MATEYFINFDGTQEQPGNCWYIYVVDFLEKMKQIFGFSIVGVPLAYVRFSISSKILASLIVLRRKTREIF